VLTGRQNCHPVVKICRPVSPNFSHWAALKLCTALQNLLNFVVITKNLCTCVSPEVTHSLKLRRTLWNDMCGDATKSIVCLRTLASAITGVAKLLHARAACPALRTFECGSLSFPKNYVFICFLFLLQSVEML